MELDDFLAPRPMVDMVAGVCRVTLAGQEYALPDKSIEANERWKAQLDTVLTALLTAFDEQGEDVRRVMDAVSLDPEPFIQLLLSYDHDGLLPDRETLRATVSEADLMFAVIRCWRAASPKADIALAAAWAGIGTATLPRLTSVWLASMAGPSAPFGES